MKQEQGTGRDRQDRLIVRWTATTRNSHFPEFPSIKINQNYYYDEITFFYFRAGYVS
jgi:hypothetical protein